jgi:hypothetical protein
MLDPVKLSYLAALSINVSDFRGEEGVIGISQAARTPAAQLTQVCIQYLLVPLIEILDVDDFT